MKRWELEWDDSYITLRTHNGAVFIDCNNDLFSRETEVELTVDQALQVYAALGAIIGEASRA